MPLGDMIRRRPRDSEACPVCGTALPAGAIFCPGCGIRVDDPDAQPLHIVDRTTGLFNDRFIRPVLEDELARAHRYGRPLGVLLIESGGDGDPPSNPKAGAPADGKAEARAPRRSDAGSGSKVECEDCLKVMAAALARTLRDVDTPGVLTRRPAQLLALLPDTDMTGTAHAANRVLNAVNAALDPLGRSASVGLVCIRPAQRFRAGAVIEAAGRSLRAGRPELLGR